MLTPSDNPHAPMHRASLLMMAGMFERMGTPIGRIVAEDLQREAYDIDRRAEINKQMEGER